MSRQCSRKWWLLEEQMEWQRKAAKKWSKKRNVQCEWMSKQLGGVSLTASQMTSSTFSASALRFDLEAESVLGFDLSIGHCCLQHVRGKMNRVCYSGFAKVSPWPIKVTWPSQLWRAHMYCGTCLLRCLCTGARVIVVYDIMIFAQKPMSTSTPSMASAHRSD